MTYEKRLRFQSATKNCSAFLSSVKAGTLLFDSLVDFLELKPFAYDPLLMSQMSTVHEKVQLSKTIPQLYQSAPRRDPDWSLNYADCFVKSQLCTKIEKMGQATAKAGQTLTSFHAEALLYLGPVVRYLDHVIDLQKPKNIHIHSRKSDEKLNDFVAQNWQPRMSKNDDYTSFDMSQNGEFLNFECMLMRFYNIPEEFINFYVHMKLNCRVFMGNLTIMRLTGEFCTFSFNTLGNMAWQNLRYNIPKQTACLFGGDDSAINYPVKERKTWARMQNLFQLQSKREYGKFVTFCGWILTPSGIIKKSKLLAARIICQEEMGNIEAAVNNYSLEARFAYNLGDLLYEYLDPDDLTYQAYINRYFTRYSKVTKTNLLKPPCYSTPADLMMVLK